MWVAGGRGPRPRYKRIEIEAGGGPAKLAIIGKPVTKAPPCALESVIACRTGS
jgi:hypothetical protein